MALKAVLVGLVTLVGVASLMAAGASGATLLEVVQGDPDLSTLATILQSTGAGKEAADPGRRLTVFAPTNGAIQRLVKCYTGLSIPLPAEGILGLAALFSRTVNAELGRTARYHMTEKAADWGAVQAAKGYVSLLDGVRVGTNGGGTGLVGATAALPVAVVNTAAVAADNGVLYKVDFPLLPYAVPANTLNC